MNILMILTSHDALGNTGEQTGFWLEEFTTPYYALLDAGAVITLASPKGGQPPIDPQSTAPEAQTKTTQRFAGDHDAQQALADTVRLNQINADNFDAVFYPGGHGPMWDLAEDAQSIALIEAFTAAEKPHAFVCHAPAVLRHTRKKDGSPLVSGKRVTGFSNSEEHAVGLTNIVPFLLEDMLIENGAHYEKGADWQPFAITDGNLITGQNPVSSTAVAQALLHALEQ